MDRTHSLHLSCRRRTYVVVALRTNTYPVEAYSVYSTSTLPTVKVCQSIPDSVLPLAGSRLLAELGLGMGCMVLGFVASVSVLVPIMLMKYGESMRVEDKFEVHESL